MKVVQIVPEFCLGGGEIMAEKLIYGLKKAGCEVVAVSMYNYHSAITDRLEKNGIRVEYLDKKSGFDFGQFIKFYKLLKKEKPDVIHNHLYSLKYVMPGAVLTKVPVRIHTVHNVASKEVGKTTGILHKIFFKWFRVVPVGLTKFIQGTVMEKYGLSSAQAPYVLNGMPVDEYVKKTDYTSNTNILHVARFHESKNHRGLIEAFEMLHRKYPDVKLNLVGTGELENEIKELVNSKGLQDSVFFKGLLDDVKEEMSKADIFCLPSNYEGMPMTIIEAMASGLPVAATAVGGVPDMITDGEDGLLCSNTPQNIADCLEKLIASEELRERLGKNAVETSKKYSSDNMAKKYYDLYLGFINQRRKNIYE